MMNIQVRAKDITLSEHSKLHIDTAIGQFSKYNLDITTTNVVIEKAKKAVNVEFDIHIAHNSPIVINQTDDDLDTAIDLAIDRANKALRRLHDKITSHRGSGIKEIELVEEA